MSEKATLHLLNFVCHAEPKTSFWSSELEEVRRNLVKIGWEDTLHAMKDILENPAQAVTMEAHEVAAVMQSDPDRVYRNLLKILESLGTHSDTQVRIPFSYIGGAVMCTLIRFNRPEVMSELLALAIEDDLHSGLLTSLLLCYHAVQLGKYPDSTSAHKALWLVRLVIPADLFDMLIPKFKFREVFLLVEYARLHLGLDEVAGDSLCQLASCYLTSACSEGLLERENDDGVPLAVQKALEPILRSIQPDPSRFFWHWKSSESEFKAESEAEPESEPESESEPEAEAEEHQRCQHPDPNVSTVSNVPNGSLAFLCINEICITCYESIASDEVDRDMLEVLFRFDGLEELIDAIGG